MNNVLCYATLYCGLFKALPIQPYEVVPKGLLTVHGFFLCNAEFSPYRALPEYVQALIHFACLRILSVTPRVIVYRLYRVR